MARVIFEDEIEDIYPAEVEVLPGGWLKVYTETTMETRLYPPRQVKQVQGYSED